MFHIYSGWRGDKTYIVAISKNHDMNLVREFIIFVSNNIHFTKFVAQNIVTNKTNTC